MDNSENAEVDQLVNKILNSEESEETKAYKKRYAKRQDRIFSFLIWSDVIGWALAIPMGLIIFSSLHGSIPNETGFIRDIGNMLYYLFGQWMCGTN